MSDINFDIMPVENDVPSNITDTHLFKQWVGNVEEMGAVLFKNSGVLVDEEEAQAGLLRIIREEVAKADIVSPRIELVNHVRHWSKETDLFSVLNFIDQNNMTICDNGSVFVKHSVLESMHYNFQSGLMASRDVVKAKEKKFEALMKQKESEAHKCTDPEQKKILESEAGNFKLLMNFHNVENLGFKVAGNGAYGAMGKKGSVHYSKDVIGAITGQGRAVVSTAISTIERILGDNFGFKNIDQTTEYIRMCLNHPTSYLPNWKPNVTTKKVVDRLLAKTYYKDYAERQSNKKYITQIVKPMTYDEKVIIYYKCNFVELIIDNPYLKSALKAIANSPVDFLASSQVPESIKGLVQFVVDLCMSYAYIPQLDYAKQERIITGIRRTAVYYDTDSCYVSFKYIVDILRGVGVLPQEKNNEQRYRILSTLGRFVDIMFLDILKLYVENYNADEDMGTRFIKIKNEFLFDKIILTANKKRYLCLIRIREGEFFEMGEIELKGLDLIKSLTNENTKKLFEKIIEKRMLVDRIDHHGIITDIYEHECSVINSIHNGECTYLNPSKVKAAASYGAGVGRIPAVAGYKLWNRLYPMESMEGGGVYRIEVKLSHNTIAQMPESMQPILTDVLNNGIKEAGLMPNKCRWICLPFSSEKIPLELLPILNIDSVVLAQAKRISDILNALGLGTISLKTIDKVGSGLLKV